VSQSRPEPSRREKGSDNERTYSHKWSISFIEIIVIANDAIKGGSDECREGMEEMIVAATTEDGDRDGAPDRQQWTPGG
jgi:hypothetical protein